MDEETDLGRLPVIILALVVGGITLGVGSSILGTIYDAQEFAYTYSVSNESYSLVNGTNFTTGLSGNSLASVILYNGDRTVTYTEGQNYTVDYLTGNIGLFNILA